MRIPVHLSCNHQQHPVCIDTEQFFFGWQIPEGMQQAYRIRMNIFQDNRYESFWDSGTIESTLSVCVPYSGPALKPLSKYCWQVQCITEDGNETDWSEPSAFLTGHMDPGNWKADWISDHDAPPPEPVSHFRNGNRDNPPPPPEPDPALYLRKKIELRQTPSLAILVWCGLGYCELQINGAPPVDEVLFPAFTDYTRRLLYRAADVTQLLNESGSHVISAVLGNGFFNIQTPDLFQMERAPWRQPPRLIAELHLTYPDGTEETILTDPSWRTADGPIRFNCIRGGETIDMNACLGAWQEPEYDDSSWSTANKVTAPAGRLSAQFTQPIRTMKTFPPATMTVLPDSRIVADFNGNLVGWTSLDVCAHKDQTITLRHGEALNKDGSLNRSYGASHTYGRYQEQKCICSGQPDHFEPRFTYHGFRYVEIEGLDKPPACGEFTAKRVYTDMEHSGQFDCSDERLNGLHDACRRTLEDCAYSSPTAEAVREKVAWGGDNVLCMRSFFSMFNAAPLYRKYISDVLEAQADDGHIPPVLPTNGWGRPDPDGNREFCDEPGIGRSLVEDAIGLYTWYGDRNILEDILPAGLRYLDYLSGTAENGLINWSLGDWMDKAWDFRSGPGLTPVSLTGTLFWYRLARQCAWISQMLKQKKAAERCTQLASTIRDRFQKEFVHPDGRVSTGSQSAQALSLFHDILEDSCRQGALRHLVDAVHKADGHLTSGFFGTLPVLRMLADHGYGQLAHQAVTQPSGSGWLWQLDSEYPTLGESIHPEISASTHHHQFSACVADWLYSYLGGIRPDRNHPGFEEYIVRPIFPRELDQVHASVESPRGTVAVSWERIEKSRLKLQLTVPGNSRARLMLHGDAALISTAGTDCEFRNTTPVFSPGEHDIILSRGEEK